ncbi:MAG: divalent metal cation transporter [Candidatus Omnitrophica bacterium]|nr:divalent metal cation transporter [Candidatus Omnitrophota bacterium]MBU1996415.1 divalent metal cation transporter [Candidatus Omnitrophota bacterium]MBU4332841.1 divalent metal cation transporter [Candidatus Omnitrophota bacterium]
MAKRSFMGRFSGFFKALGPGIIFAGTSIGVSHIVHSTRAGANYGFTLLGLVILINVLKYPFFEFGPRYVTATQENLLLGYKRLGNWAFYLYLALAFATMFPIQAAVTMVSTGLLVNLLGWSYPPVYLAAIILSVCAVVLIIGKYPLFDKTMKLMMVILFVSTITAFAMALGSRGEQAGAMCGKFTWDLSGISFLVVLMGWMPSTIDISVWHSFWSSERIKQTKYVPTMKETLFDFHLGYWLTMVMAVFFLGLGALVMFNSGEVFSNSAVTFTGQVISLYTKALGQWSFPVIATAATVTMFSTSLSCFDAYTRIVREASVIVFPKTKDHADMIYLMWMIVLAVVSTVIIGKFIHQLKTFVDFATTLSFLAAPVFAYINYRTVTSEHMPAYARPGKKLRILSWTGIIFLSFFGILYLLSKIFL